MNILNQTLEEREAKISQVLDYILQTQKLFTQFASPELKAAHGQFEPLIEGLKSDKIRLVVIGEFSRGKSRLVNALLGIDLLPSAKEATTAINTFLQSPPRDRANNKYIRLNFTPESNLPFQELNWDDDSVLKKWGTELDRSNKEARLALQSIDVFAPHELLDKGLVIIDTPGLESVVAHHEEITRKAIAGSHIAIWVQSVEQLGGNSREWAFLTDTVRQNFRKFLTVVNMWDQVLDPEDDHDREKPENERVEEKLNKVRENFRTYLSDLPANELTEMTNDAHLMGVSAKWALDKKRPENRARSGIDKLIQRIADLCNSGEAQQEIFYKPLQQLSGIQKTLASALEDEIHTLNDSRTIKEQQNELELLEQEIKNQELEQKQTAKEFKDEHYRAAQVITKKINENLVQPLKSLKGEIDTFLTEDFIKREVEAGRKNIGLPREVQTKYQQTTTSVSEAWLVQQKELQSSLNDLKSGYIDAMQKHNIQLQESLGGISFELPKMEVNLQIDLSKVVEYQNKKLELERNLEKSEAEIERFELEAASLSSDDSRIIAAKKALERAERQLHDLGHPPTPDVRSSTEYVDDFYILLPWTWGDKKAVTRTHTDDSNVKQFHAERTELKGDVVSRAKMYEKLMAEEAAKNSQRQTAEVLKRKAEQKCAKLEKERKEQDQNLAKEQKTLITNTLRQLRAGTVGELESRIKYLENSAGKAVELLFFAQLEGLLKCVEEQFMQPLRAKQAKREEVVQLFEQGKAEIEHRKAELARAKMELDDVMMFTTSALSK